MDTETEINGEIIDQAIAGLAQLTGLPVMPASPRCAAHAPGTRQTP